MEEAEFPGRISKGRTCRGIGIHDVAASVEAEYRNARPLHGVACRPGEPPPSGISAAAFTEWISSANCERGSPPSGCKNRHRY